jgi:hypothetical protein
MYRGIKKGLRATLLLAALLSLTSTLVQSAASSDWSEPVNLSDWQADLFTSFSLKLSEDGTLAAYWVRINTSTEWSLWARVRTPDGTWSPAENLSGWIKPVDLSGGMFMMPWTAAITPQGTAWAAWVEDTSTPGADSMWLRAAYKAPGEPWQRDDASAGYDTFILSLGFVFGPQGHGLLVWSDCTQNPADGGICLVRARRRAPTAPAWGVLEGLDDPSTGYPIYYVQALAGPQGDFVVLWDENDTNTLEAVYWSRAFDGQAGAWEPAPVNLSGARESFYQTPAVIDPAGTVTAGFIALSSPGLRSNYAVTRSAASGAWSVPVAISGEVYALSGPRLAVGQDGTVMAAWAQGNAALTDWAIFANARDAGAVWGGSAAQVTPRRNSISDPYLGIWPDGSTLLVWSEQDASRPTSADEAVFYRVRPAFGLWGAAGEGQLGGWVEDVFFNMDLDVSLDGRAGLVWSVTDASQPANQQQAVFSALWAPGGPWDLPEQLSAWTNSVWVERQDSLALGRLGSPLAVTWYENRTTLPDDAIFLRSSGLLSRQVLIPMVLRPPGG